MVIQVPWNHYYILLARASEDNCVYVKKAIEGIVFLTLYVDDTLLAGNNLEMIKSH